MNLLNNSHSMHFSVSFISQRKRPSIIFPFLSSTSISIQPPLEHGNRVRGIRRPRLCHVPMLNNASSLHPINICQRNGFLARLINTHVGETDVVVEALSEHGGGDIWDDWERDSKSAFRTVEESLDSLGRKPGRYSSRTYGRAYT